jgi:pyrimidine operon attenuation protein / uracil phosphoribosyltransferase
MSFGPERRILETADMQRGVQRMAAELLESLDLQKPLYMVAIFRNGLPLAELLIPFLEPEFPAGLHLLTANPDKSAPWKHHGLQTHQLSLANAQVVVVDDVLNTGKTVSYLMAALLEHKPERIRLAVLVDRAHKTFPLQADVAGFRLSTLPGQFVRVNMEMQVPEIWISDAL